jgi:adenosine/AMP kinase
MITEVHAMELKTVKVAIPDGVNVIIGQAHFIKTVEDLYEATVTTCPGCKFGIAFAEASGECLIRHDGNESGMENFAVEACMAIGAGHTFIICIKEGYPISVLNALKGVHEVCNVFCATANPLEVILAESETGRGILGVIDGSRPKGVEGDAERAQRIAFLRKIGYKR